MKIAWDTAKPRNESFTAIMCEASVDGIVIVRLTQFVTPTEIQERPASIWDQIQAMKEAMNRCLHINGEIHPDER